MTYKQLIQTIGRHRGALYASINAHGGQFQIPANKQGTLRLLRWHAAKYGEDRETDLVAELQGTEMFIDVEPIDPI